MALNMVNEIILAEKGLEDTLTVAESILSLNTMEKILLKAVQLQNFTAVGERVATEESKFYDPLVSNVYRDA